MRSSFRRLATALTTAAVLASGCSPTTDEAGSPSAAVPTSAPTPSPSPTPSPTPVAAEPGVLLMWARGGLPGEVVEAAAGLEHVTHVTTRTSDTLGLVGSRDAQGRPVDDLADGWQVPVAATAVDPTTYGPVVDDPGARATIEALHPGEVVLSTASADRRGLEVGGEVDLAGLPGLRVVGIVPDAEVGNSELLLHLDDATAAGIDRGPSLVLLHDAPDEEARAALVAALEAVVPDDVTARVVDTQDPALRRDAPLVLSLGQLKEQFGEFAYRPRAGVRDVDADPAWVEANIVAAQVPILGTVRCHRGIVDDLRAALQEVVDAGLAGEIDPADYAGCHYARRISTDRARLSSHSWGIALDINVDLSLPGLGPPPHPEVVAAFMRNGFRWGGDFLTPDNHHFEWVGGDVQPPPGRSDDPSDPT